MSDRRAMLCGLAMCGWMLMPAPMPAAAHDTASPDPLEPPARMPLVRTMCPNYVEVLSATTYPRDAIQRHLDEGEAVVAFVVEQGRVGQVTVVSASDPAFGAAAAAAVARFECERTEQPVHFRIPFKYKREAESRRTPAASPP